MGTRNLTGGQKYGKKRPKFYQPQARKDKIKRMGADYTDVIERAIEMYTKENHGPK